MMKIRKTIDGKKQVVEIDEAIKIVKSENTTEDKKNEPRT